MLRRLLLLLTFAAIVAARLAAASDEPARTSFIDRIRPADFEAAERLFGEAISRTNDIVVLQTNTGKPLSALAITRATKDHFAVTFRIPPNAPGGEWLSVSTEIDAALGQQIERAVAFTLNKNVMFNPSAGATPQADAAMWVFQRMSSMPVAAATISWAAAHANPEAARFMDALIGNLQRLVGAEGADREKLLEEIDRVATQITLAHAGQ